MEYQTLTSQDKEGFFIVHGELRNFSYHHATTVVGAGYDADFVLDNGSVVHIKGWGESGTSKCEDIITGLLNNLKTLKGHLKDSIFEVLEIN